jgi:hypothetical protein
MKLYSDIQPRHVLCILGRENGFTDLRHSIQSSIDNFATDFEIDGEYSQDEADDRMEESFFYSWDRVVPQVWSPSDEEAVRDHGCVIYLLGPPMTAEHAVEVSGVALRLVVEALRNGATAVKGESAGVAHGVDRWRELGQLAERANGPLELGRVCRLAFVRRPISDGDVLCSVGHHLVGLPEVCVSRKLSDDEHELVALIDGLADEMLDKGPEAALADSEKETIAAQIYEEDDFMYNPYGAVHLTFSH